MSAPSRVEVRLVVPTNRLATWFAVCNEPAHKSKRDPSSRTALVSPRQDVEARRPLLANCSDPDKQNAQLTAEVTGPRRVFLGSVTAYPFASLSRSVRDWGGWSK